MSLLMDALNRAETIKKTSPQNEEDPGESLISANEKPAQETQAIEIEDTETLTEWEEKLALINERDPDVKVESDEVKFVESGNWQDSLLFECDASESQTPATETPVNLSVEEKFISENEAVIENRDQDENKESFEVSTALVVDDDESELSAVRVEENPLPVKEESVAVANSPASTDEDSIFSTRSEELPTDSHLMDAHHEEKSIKFVDWLDNQIDEAALAARHLPQEPAEPPPEEVEIHPENPPDEDVSEELLRLEDLAEGDAVHPHIAKRLFTAHETAPRSRRNSLWLFGLLGILVLGVGGGFTYYYHMVTSSGVSFNTAPIVKFERRAFPAPPPPAAETVAVQPLPSQPELAVKAEDSRPTQPAEPNTLKLPMSIPVEVTPVRETPEIPKNPPVANGTPVDSPQKSPSTTELKEKFLGKLAKEKPIPKEKPSTKTQTLPKEATPSPKKNEPVRVQTEPGIHTLRKTVKPQDITGLSRAYAAFQQGDLKIAQRDYSRVLQTDPTNRDALLGLAAIALQRYNSTQAQHYYQQVLKLYPQDTFAQVGLIDALGNRAPDYSESQLKSLLKNAPDAASIHFSLGNFYARQGQWNQAQAAYFSAYRYHNNHPDYAYNLAISLDQINQPQLALTYYQTALQLIQRQKVAYNFNPQALQHRIQTLTAYYQKNNVNQK